MYSAYYTPQTISNFIKVINEQVQDFKQRSLAQQYAVVYLDATYLPLAIGIQANGHKEVLGYQLAPTESSTVWTGLLLDLKQRGLQQALLFVTDGLVGLESSLSQSFLQDQCKDN